MATIEPEIVYLVSYRCACCQAELQAPTERPTAWLRCPHCGRASLPPTTAVKRRKAPAPVAATTDELLVIGPPPEPRPMTPVSVRDELAGGSSDLADPSPTSAFRVVYGSVLFLSLTMLLFSYLDQSVIGSSLFSVVALISLILLVLASRSGTPAE